MASRCGTCGKANGAHTTGCPMDTTAPALYIGTDADAYLAGIARYDKQVTDEMDADTVAHKLDVIDVMIDRAILLLSRPVLTAEHRACAYCEAGESQIHNYEPITAA